MPASCFPYRKFGTTGAMQLALRWPRSPTKSLQQRSQISASGCYFLPSLPCPELTEPCCIRHAPELWQIDKIRGPYPPTHTHTSHGKRLLLLITAAWMGPTAVAFSDTSRIMGFGERFNVLVHQLLLIGLSLMENPELSTCHCVWLCVGVKTHTRKDT